LDKLLANHFGVVK